MQWSHYEIYNYEVDSIVLTATTFATISLEISFKIRSIMGITISLINLMIQ
jgi:hypothetical protein